MHVCEYAGADPGFFKGGSQGNGYMYKIYYIHIAIIHIIILNEVHCNLLKAIDGLLHESTRCCSCSSAIV